MHNFAWHSSSRKSFITAYTRVSQKKHTNIYTGNQFMPNESTTPTCIHMPVSVKIGET